MIKTFTILANGAISRTITCRETSLPDQLDEGETAIEGSFPSNLYKIEAGVPIALPSQEKSSVNIYGEKVSERMFIRALKAIRRDINEGNTSNLTQLINRLEK